MIVRSFLLCLLLFVVACQSNIPVIGQANNRAQATKPVEVTSAPVKKMLESAHEQTKVTKTYDPAYVVLPYPGGDVPMEKGVCTDVVIRAFRKAGVDLQKEVHEDMSENFTSYPKKWGLPGPDKNIDHRRVPNLDKFFARKGKALKITQDSGNYQPGDVVSWHLNEQGTTHIGLVSDIWNEETKRYLIIHNIGSGAQAEDVLFDWKITGHYRYF
jgi:hypothetical protein